MENVRHIENRFWQYLSWIWTMPICVHVFMRCFYTSLIRARSKPPECDRVVDVIALSEKISRNENCS